MLTPYRSRLLASTLLVSAALGATSAQAQTADPASQPKTGVQSTDASAPAAGISSQDSAPPAGENSQGDIVVTGSLISNPALVASSPVTVIGQEEINLRQTNTAEQILREYRLRCERGADQKRRAKQTRTVRHEHVDSPSAGPVSP